MKQRDLKQLMNVKRRKKRKMQLLVLSSLLATPAILDSFAVEVQAETASYGVKMEAAGSITIDGVNVPIKARSVVRLTNDQELIIDGVKYNLTNVKSLVFENVQVTESGNLDHLKSLESLVIKDTTFTEIMNISYNPQLVHCVIERSAFHRTLNFVGNRLLTEATIIDSDFVNPSLTEYAVHANSNANGFKLHLNDCRYAGSNRPHVNSTIHNIQGTTHFGKNEEAMGPSTFVEKGLIIVDGVEYNVAGKKIWSSYTGNRLIIRENNASGAILVSVDAPKTLIFDGVQGNLIDVNGLKGLTQLIVKDSRFDNYLAAGSGSLVDCQVTNTSFGQYIHVRWNPNLDKVAIDHVSTGSYITVNDNGHANTEISISHTYAKGYID